MCPGSSCMLVHDLNFLTDFHGMLFPNQLFIELPADYSKHLGLS